jgi:transposase InsO family protein
MQVQRSGYYAYIKKRKAPVSSVHLRLVTEVRAIHARVRASYGSRRISKALQAQGYCVGRYRARRLMKAAGIECRQRRLFRVKTTQSKHDFPIAPNVLNRDFNPVQPNRVWSGDITFIPTMEGWLYLAILLDLYSRKVVGFALADHLQTALINQALNQALCLRQPKAGLVHHSDRGSQYAGFDYQQALQAAHITVSMSRRGNCYDNSPTERFFGSLKAEWLDQKNYSTQQEAINDTIDYIRFYNTERLHSTLGYLSPSQFELQHQLNPLTKLSTFT